MAEPRERTPEGRIGVIIAEPDETIRASLEAAVRDQSDMRLVCSVDNAREAVEPFRNKHPAVLLIDLEMPLDPGFLSEVKGILHARDRRTRFAAVMSKGPYLLLGGAREAVVRKPGQIAAFIHKLWSGKTGIRIPAKRSPEDEQIASALRSGVIHGRAALTEPETDQSLTPFVLLATPPASSENPQDTREGERRDMHMNAVKWKAFNSYQEDELRVLIFPTIEELEKCVALLWEEPALKGCPHDSGDGETLWVPADAASIIQARGIKVDVRRPVTHVEMPKEELARLRHESGV